MDTTEYVSIPINDDEVDQTKFTLCQFTDDQVIDHILTKISVIYTHITRDYISPHFYALKNKLGMHYPSDYIEELYTNFQTSADTGYYYYGHYLPNPASVYRSTQEPGTFLVNREMDFIFTYMIDIITIVQHCATEGETASAIVLADNRCDERMRLHKLCKDPDCTEGLCVSMGSGTNSNTGISRLCSLCWVLYTRIDSDFYQKCLVMIESNKYINFTSSAYESLDIEHRLFTHVLFLCGKSILPESRDNNSDYAQYNGINKWIVLPIWFHLLIQGNNNNNNNNTNNLK